MYLMVFRVNNLRPTDENIIGSYPDLPEAIKALRKECKDKKKYLTYEGDTMAMFTSKKESWVIEIWSENTYNKRKPSK